MRALNPAIARWFVSLPAIMFYSIVVIGLHDNLGSPEGLPGLAVLLAAILLRTSIALWLLTDARRHGRSLPYDSDSFFYFIWPVLGPVYLFQTRGAAAFLILGKFGLLVVSAWILSTLPTLLTLLLQ
ncbi:MAG TPA: hypothetical protein VMZ27_13205 [Candidatus Saccharimonadales bacterium]|nr:hypothetical protein [Candidatus Saccharimonadales bacterium]